MILPLPSLLRSFLFVILDGTTAKERRACASKAKNDGYAENFFLLPKVTGGEEDEEEDEAEEARPRYPVDGIQCGSRVCIPNNKLWRGVTRKTQRRGGEETGRGEAQSDRKKEGGNYSVAKIYSPKY